LSGALSRMAARITSTLRCQAAASRPVPRTVTSSGSSSSPTSTLPSVKTPPGTPNVQGALGAVNNAIGAATAPLGGVTQSVPSVPLPSQPQSTTPTSTPNNGAPTAQQAQQLLNYLLSP